MKRFLIAGIIFAFLAVLLGAFGAHALKDRLAIEYLEIWKTAVTYQMFHSLALMLCALIGQKIKLLSMACGCFVLGMLLFSGSLYLLVLSGIKMLGMITPIGGTLFLLGWLLMLIGVVRDFKTAP